MGGWYNGYPWPERWAKHLERERLKAAGTLAQRPGPCSICADPDAAVEPHGEDYSQPYRWNPPAEYMLCRTCHRNKLHKRFSNPIDWLTHLAHVRRGGYSSDLKVPAIQGELKSFRIALRRGERRILPALRTVRAFATVEWWESLSVAAESLQAPASRPRP